MPYDDELFMDLDENLRSLGLPQDTWVNDSQSDEPPAPRDEVGIPYDQATPQMVEGLIRFLTERGVKPGDIKVAVVVEFGVGEGWD